MIANEKSFRADPPKIQRTRDSHKGGDRGQNGSGESCVDRQVHDLGDITPALIGVILSFGQKQQWCH